MRRMCKAAFASGGDSPCAGFVRGPMRGPRARVIPLIDGHLGMGCQGRVAAVATVPGGAGGDPHLAAPL